MLEATKNEWKTVTKMPAKQFDMQAAAKTHSSQPTGADAFDGQHGMLFAIWPVNSEPDVSSAIGCIDMAENVSAITGRDNGANAKPAINRIVSSRRMAEFLFTKIVSHKSVATESPTLQLP